MRTDIVRTLCSILSKPTSHSGR